MCERSDTHTPTVDRLAFVAPSMDFEVIAEVFMPDPSKTP
jgi:hypothetical protein